MAFVVSDEYRTNNLSLIPGGAKLTFTFINIITDKEDERVYTKVKRPMRYIDRALKTNSKRQSNLKLLKVVVEEKDEDPVTIWENKLNLDNGNID